ncbi:MAG: 4-hydroxy-tetrahydrodipicolinate reductase [Clostridia bacterium]|nr:4-hydroxy-tetrahydrodipicolinate reductase [Clostridia bacterium]
MNILLNGASGYMGREVMKLLEAPDCEDTLIACVDLHTDGLPSPAYTSLADVRERADVIIDFSHHTATNGLLAYALRHKTPVVIATTGQTEEENAAIKAASAEIPVFFSANMSLGVALLAALVRLTVKTFPAADVEIVETHHNRKVDVPSGTALMLARSVQSVREDAEFVIGRHENGKKKPNEVGISSLRLGNVVGEHEVHINTGSETITLRHQAHSRSLFADGALVAARFLVDCKAGLYTLASLFRDSN